MKKIIFFIFLITCLFFISCNLRGPSDITGNSVPNRFNAIEDLGKPDYLADISEEYTFIIITDLHYGAEKSFVPEERFFEWLDEKKQNDSLPEFCLSLGDDADHGAENEMIIYKKFADRIESYGIPVFNTIGNHDLYNSGWKYWKQYATTGMVRQTGAAYRFETNNISIYALDSGTAVFGSEQINSLQNYFKDDTNPKIVFSHYPVYIDKFLFCKEDTIERNLVLDIMAKNNVKLYFGGHVHLFDRQDFGKYQTFSLEALGYQHTWTEVTVKESENDFSYSFNTIK